MLTCLLESDRVAQPASIVLACDVLTGGIHHKHVREDVICNYQARLEAAVCKKGRISPHKDICCQGTEVTGVPY